MHIKGLRTKVLISLVDTIHSDKTTDGLIALIEVDMNKNLELVYITPDFLVSLSTLFKHINLLLNQKDII